MKRVLLLILTVGLVYILGTGVFAAPKTLDPEYNGTAQIITVTNPDNGITTFKSHVVVSVTGDEGVVVTLYVYNPETRQYELYTDKNGENSWFIGPSGLFVKRVPIGPGINYIGAFAELNGYDQFVKRRVDQSKSLKTVLIKKIEDVMDTVGSN